jgi:hypothetical protein
MIGAGTSNRRRTTYSSNRSNNFPFNAYSLSQMLILLSSYEAGTFFVSRQKARFTKNLLGGIICLLQSEDLLKSNARSSTISEMFSALNPGNSAPKNYL